MTYYRCTTCNRPILFREFTDYGRQCKKCGEPIKASVKAKVVPHHEFRPQFKRDENGYRKVENQTYVKVDPVIPEKEMSLRDVKELVADIEHRNSQTIDALEKIQNRLGRLVKELNK